MKKLYLFRTQVGPGVSIYWLGFICLIAISIASLDHSPLLPFDLLCNNLSVIDLHMSKAIHFQER